MKDFSGKLPALLYIFRSRGYALETSRKILKQKKSARISMETLLAAIYGRDICL
jgi:hypothetical protein